ncbi:nuclear transport factor 2 family protein [Rhodococcus sp. NPDC003382]
MTTYDGAALVELHQLYARQSHLIDGGEAAGWAETFTPDGEFHSPSYPAPAVGAAELTEFARNFHDGGVAAGEVYRHVITNLCVVGDAGDALDVRAYLQIVATTLDGDSRLVRMTTVADRVVRHDGHWRIARRSVTRDDS